MTGKQKAALGAVAVIVILAVLFLRPAPASAGAGGGIAPPDVNALQMPALYNPNLDFDIPTLEGRSRSPYGMPTPQAACGACCDPRGGLGSIGYGNLSAPGGIMSNALRNMLGMDSDGNLRHAQCQTAVDWTAYYNDPRNADLRAHWHNLTGKDRDWIARHGYPVTPGGYAQFMANTDTNFIRDIENGRRPDPNDMVQCERLSPLISNDIVNVLRAALIGG